MRDVLPFYAVLLLLLPTIMVEERFSRFVRGQTDDLLFAGIKEHVPALADAAWSCVAPRRIASDGRKSRWIAAWVSCIWGIEHECTDRSVRESTRDKESSNAGF